MVGRSLAFAACTALVGCQLVLALEDRVEHHAELDGLDAESDTGAGPRDAGAERTSPPPDASCETPRLSCGGACVDPETDPSHCGACDHACLGAACAHGECAPEKLADVAYGLIAAVDATEVFYRPVLYETLTGALLAQNKATGAERTVVSDLGRWYATAPLGDEIAIVENGPSPRVRRIHRTTGASALLYEQAAQSPPFQNVAVDGDTLYFTTKADVRRVKTDGSDYAVLQSVADGPNGATVIAISNTKIFFGVADSANLYGIDKASPFAAPSIVGAGGAPVSTVAVIGGDVIWTSGAHVHVLSAGGATTTRQLGLREAHSAASRGGMFYIYDVEFGTTTSRILRFDPKSGTAVVLASGLADGRLAVDDTHVYFANYAGGLYRIAR